MKVLLSFAVGKQEGIIYGHIFLDVEKLNQINIEAATAEISRRNENAGIAILSIKELED